MPDAARLPDLKDETHTAFASFMEHLSAKTGKKVTWRDATSSADQIKAMRDAKVHIAGNL